MPRSKKQSSEAAVRDIRRKTRRRFSTEEKIRIVLDGMRGELSVAELCRRAPPLQAPSPGIRRSSSTRIPPDRSPCARVSGRRNRRGCFMRL